MPKARPTVVSLWVLRDEEHPEAAARNYPGMLQVLQRSCDRLGLRHLVLTDRETANSSQWPDVIEPWAPTSVPRPLMQACTELQARYLEARPETDTLFVGADCIFLQDPARSYPIAPGLCVTYRNPLTKYSINTGAQLVRRHCLDSVSALFRRVADRCGTVWCDDQLALIAELAPMPPSPGIYNRADIKVAFLPMKRFNVRPRSANDPCLGATMLHFRGKAHKQLFFDWARKHGFA